MSLEECHVAVDNRQVHWEHIYRTSPSKDMSWFRAHLETSIGLITHVAPEHTAAIIDVGAGNSTLADDLIALGYSNITVVDLSQTALQDAWTRSTTATPEIERVVGDILQVTLPAKAFDVWHDRAVFHFLSKAEERQAYVKQAVSSLFRGGHLVIGTFSTAGPSRCSGLDVRRYDTTTLSAEFAPDFRLQQSSVELHQTPAGTTQSFLYCVFELL